MTVTKFAAIAAGCTLLAAPLGAAELPPIRSSVGNPVPACATPGRLTAYLRARNPRLEPRFEGIAHLYRRHGEAGGLRWDYAFFQMIVETASLTFRRPSGLPATVRPEQNNFAGLGASGAGVAGEHFPDIESGVRAHLQHVRLYGGERIADPVSERTRKVQAWGVLATWQGRLAGPVTYADLALHWAPGDRGYGSGIASVARRFYDGFCNAPDPEAAIASSHAPQRVAGPLSPPVQRAEPEPDRPSGQVLAREALARAKSEPQPRAALGAAALPEPGGEPRPAPLQPVRILNAAPEPVAATEAPAAGSSPYAAPLSDPADEALRSLVSGRTVNLDTPLGTTIPITFNPDGTTRGRAGSLATYLGAPNDDGRWWVEKARLCQRWKVWFDRETQCLRFRQAGDIIHWTRDDGRTGTARLARN